MKKLLKKYEEKQPEIVFHWKDQEIARVFAYLMVLAIFQTPLKKHWKIPIKGIQAKKKFVKPPLKSH